MRDGEGSFNPDDNIARSFEVPDELKEDWKKQEEMDAPRDNRARVFEVPEEIKTQETPEDILGVREGALPLEIKIAHRVKEKELFKQKAAGLDGNGPLVPEDDFQALAEAREVLQKPKKPLIKDSELSPESTRFTVLIESPEEKAERLEKIWDELEKPENEKLKSVLSFVLLPSEKRNFRQEQSELALKNLKEFWEYYPTEGLLQTGENNPDNLLGFIDDKEKAEYRQAIKDFKEMMYSVPKG